MLNIVKWSKSDTHSEMCREPENVPGPANIWNYQRPPKWLKLIQAPCSQLDCYHEICHSVPYYYINAKKVAHSGKELDCWTLTSFLSHKKKIFLKKCIFFHVNLMLSNLILDVSSIVRQGVLWGRKNSLCFDNKHTKNSCISAFKETSCFYFLWRSSLQHDGQNVRNN